MGFGHPHPFEQHRPRPSATWPGGMMPVVTPQPVEPFGRSYVASSTAGKISSVKARLAALQRKRTGGWSPGSTLTAAEHEEMDVLLLALHALLEEQAAP